MSAIGTTMTVKKMNVELVKTTLKGLGTATKPEIARATGLSVVTCGTILNELSLRGEILELKRDPSSGGRPAIRYEYNANFAHILCLYTRTEGEFNFLSYQVCDLMGECLESMTIPCEQISFDLIDEKIGEILSRFPKIKAVGIGIQGVVHQGVIGVCDIPSLERVEIEKCLKEKYHIEVYAENDMNLITYGYYQKQAYQEDKNIAFIYFPKDNYLGAGIIVRGHIVKGNTNFAGELSFLPFGVPRAFQIEQFNQTETMIPLAVQSIAALTAIINPELILLAGQCIQAKDLVTIKSQLDTMIPGEHQATLIYREDIHDDYMSGLCFMTFERMSYHLKLIEKKF